MPITGGWSRTNIFNTAWVKQLRPVSETGAGALIEIYSVGGDDITYDSETGELENQNSDLVFEGPARLQDVRIARNVTNNAGDTIVQAVRVQIYDLDFTPVVGQRVKVVSSDLNTNIKAYTFYIQDIVQSTNPFDQTFEAYADTKVNHG